MFTWLTEDKQDDAQIGTHVLFCVDRLEDGPQIGSPHFEKYTVRFTVCTRICTQHCGRLHRIINGHFMGPLPQSL